MGRRGMVNKRPEGCMSGCPEMVVSQSSRDVGPETSVSRALEGSGS